MNPLNPKKLLLSKWTAVKPVAKQKHFLVSRVVQPELPMDPIESVEIEAVFSKATRVIAWRELQDDEVWLNTRSSQTNRSLTTGQTPMKCLPA